MVFGMRNSGTLRVQEKYNRASGPNYSNIHGVWALKPYYLGPWTLRGSRVVVMDAHRTY